MRTDLAETHHDQQHERGAEVFRSSAFDALVIDPAHQLVLAIVAHPDSFRLVGVRHPEQTAARALLATQGTVMQLSTWHSAGKSPIPPAFQKARVFEPVQQDSRSRWIDVHDPCDFSGREGKAGHVQILRTE